MSDYNTTKHVYTALSVFITEIMKQSAAVRAYNNVLKTQCCNNNLIKVFYESTCRELISALARIFDNPNTGKYDNCTLLRLKKLCYQEQAEFLCSTQEKENVIRCLDEIIDFYNQIDIIKSRNKQLAHLGLHQVMVGNCIVFKLNDIEQLVLKTVDLYTKLAVLFDGDYEVLLPQYNDLIKNYENNMLQIIG